MKSSRALAGSALLFSLLLVSAGLAWSAAAAPPPTPPVWTRSYGTADGESTSAVAVASDGDIYLLGLSWSGTVLMKLSPEGAVRWQNKYGGTEPAASGASLLPTSDGGCLFAGSARWSAWVVRVDRNGAIVWQHRYEWNNDKGMRILEAPSGGYILSGQGGPYPEPSWLLVLDGVGNIVREVGFREQSFETDVLEARAADGGYFMRGLDNALYRFGVTKLDANLGIVWSNWYDSGLQDYSRSLRATSDGGCAVLSLDHYDQELALTKISPAGAVEWRTQYGPLDGGDASGLEVTPDGGFIVAGGNHGDGVLLRLGPTGEIIWQKAYGLRGSGRSDSFTAVKSMPSGGILASGQTNSMAPTGNGDDWWVLRLDDGGSPSASCQVELPLFLETRADLPLIAVPRVLESVTPLNQIAEISAGPVPYSAVGTACAGASRDTDADGVPDDRDTCPDTPNPVQTDTDGDGIGDACDICGTDPLNDVDYDGVCTEADNCPVTGNPSQGDADQDGVGDACDCERTSVNNCDDGNPCNSDICNLYGLHCVQLGDPDVDGDAVCAIVDNCSGVYNPDQSDPDSDGRGTACDNCPADSNPSQVDTDLDSSGDACDNCPIDYNSSQHDADQDGEGDVCDLDDGIILLFRTAPGFIDWQREAGPTTWNVYEGDLDVLRSGGAYTQAPGSNPLAERHCGGVFTYVADPEIPPSGKVIFSLVTGVRGGTEGSLGTNSAGVPRANSNPCP